MSEAAQNFSANDRNTARIPCESLAPLVKENLDLAFDVLVALYGIRPGVEVASHIRARADPFQPFKSLVERLRASGFWQVWNGSARARLYDSTSTPRFATFHFVIIVAPFLVSVVSFIIMWRTFAQRTRLRSSYRVRLSRKNAAGSMVKVGVRLVISGLSALLFSLSSALMLSKLWRAKDFDDITVAVIYSMPGFLSVLNTIATFAVHRKVRRQLVTLVGFGSHTTKAVKIPCIKHNNKYFCVTAFTFDELLFMLNRLHFFVT
ncbi:hypothetical protein Y032_0005g2475 [Ancylostoma ceylanicum]|uniref:Serpentine receptor class gamma n=1 Tax=Ancylostoma ceylanicum TaxID=53326 RepID=A0A016VRF9_9BILA|nr:hypothetical protein Y032_0005g2475 [Ancylostoma ceylanicum]